MGRQSGNRLHKVQGHTDIPLNDYGKHLAEETAEGMKDISIDLGFTSPLLRAKETAQILLRGRNVPLFEEEKIEEISFGRYEGMYSGGENSNADSEAFKTVFLPTLQIIFPPEDGETVEHLYERTGEFLQRISADESLADKNILVSTHGAAMTAILNRIKGNVSVAEFWKDEVPPNCSVTLLKPVQGG